MRNCKIQKCDKHIKLYAEKINKKDIEHAFFESFQSISNALKLMIIKLDRVDKTPYKWDGKKWVKVTNKGVL